MPNIDPKQASADAKATEGEILNVLRGELGKFGEKMAEDRKALLDKVDQLDAEVKKLKTDGVEGAARDRYTASVYDGKPIPMRSGEDPNAFIQRLLEQEGVRAVQVGGEVVPLLDKLPNGLAGQRDIRGLLPARMMRAMALAVATQRPCTHEGAIEAARQAWGEKDIVLGALEEMRDLVRDHGGSDKAKREGAQRILGTALVGSGNSLVGPPQIGPFIDFLHSIDIMRGLGVTILPLNGKSMELGYFDNGITVAYRNEHSGPNESSPTDGMLEFVRRLLGGAVAVTNELLKESSYTVDLLLRNHLGRRMMSHACTKMVLGRGLAGEIRGLDWWAEQPTTAHYADRNLATGAVTFKTILKDITQAFERIGNEDKPITAREGAKPAMITSNRDYWGLARVTDTQDRLPFYNDVRAGSILGAALAAMTAMPTNLTGDASGSGTGNKSKSFIFDANSVAIAEQQGVEFNAFPGGTFADSTGTLRSGITNRETILTADMAHDFGDLYRGKSIYRRDSIDYGVAF